MDHKEINSTVDIFMNTEYKNFIYPELKDNTK